MAWVDCEYHLPRRAAVLYLRRSFFWSGVAAQRGMGSPFQRNMTPDEAEDYARRLGALLEQLLPEYLPRCQVRSFRYDMRRDGIEVLIESPGLEEVADGNLADEFDERLIRDAVQKAGA